MKTTRRIALSLCLSVALTSLAGAALAAPGGDGATAERAVAAADGPIDSHELAPGVRAEAAEDAHWWVGIALVPEAFRQDLADAFGPSLRGATSETINVGHVFFGILVLLIAFGMAVRARRLIRGDGMPPERWSFFAFFDVIIETIFGMMKNMMPHDKALEYVPLMTAVALFILISNLLGIVPGFLPPTASLNTTLALAAFAFLYYNWQGIKVHGPLAYFKHFAGPIIWLAPLMIPIEIFSHLFRPISLSIRLMGNMFGDHQVLFRFMAFGLPLVPLPVMALGLIVVLVQTLVFTLLFMVYIALAIEQHEHAHDEHHADAHDHDVAEAGDASDLAAQAA